MRVCGTLNGKGSQYTTVMLLVDASVYIFRAYHALPASLTGADGQPANAIHGYATFLQRLLADAADERIAVAFDESLTTSFRNDLYASYKRNRELPPAELVDQFAACRHITEALGVATCASPAYEADDLIGTLARMADEPVTIVTSDKDLAQLLGADDTLWDYARDLRYDTGAIQAKFGVWPHQIPDYLALVGDTVDNIPGVPGIGARTAAALLTCFDDLDTILAQPDAVAATSIRGAAGLATKLAVHADQARLSRRLATIVTDIDPVECPRHIDRRAPDAGALAALCTRLGLGPGIRARLGALAA